VRLCLGGDDPAAAARGAGGGRCLIWPQRWGRAAGVDRPEEPRLASMRFRLATLVRGSSRHRTLSCGFDPRISE
jgi:hypothetical protein